MAPPKQESNAEKAAKLDRVERLWREEMAERQAAQAKAEAVREQSARIWTDLMESQQAEKQLRGERDRLRDEVGCHARRGKKGCRLTNEH